MEKDQIETYFLDEKPRPLFLIFPGGAYSFTSWREGGPIARKYNEIGMHAAVCKYRNEKLVYPDLVDNIEQMEKPLFNDPRVTKVFVVGFSAGGHLALQMMTRHPEKYSGGILCYPVVMTQGEYCHQESISNLLGSNYSQESVKAINVIDHITKDMPPLFVWHTEDDDTVPVENSLRLLKKAKEIGVKMELHIFPEGVHGLALATEETPFFGEDPEIFAKKNKHVATWFNLMKEWLKTI
ncbi:MAG TPA: prolyl oligopeptidase family serine peptidase [Bacillota bacterium]|nr:prolyl oligopeptidase family serine peptidase [Bacillota bacterium]HPF42766.1 prolyl oligopeptidase family serine peptidase [Bacillota bacterium]HPJ86086.1 prolyl oligopeptidase family serine peptidase [Bacillota bacterium]HPQ62305.1 prolyl oligopeptidase family serine peptidase [Bacillota bacterium]HRX91597.1 prolyl oligopeptidase family serine peptidase [Candidatus Izemoplasmatales bacterium]